MNKNCIVIEIGKHRWKFERKKIEAKHATNRKIGFFDLNKEERRKNMLFDLITLIIRP